MERNMIEILRILDRASCSCPLGYISLHTGIENPLKIIEALENKGYVSRCKDSTWSPSKNPQFEINPKGRQKLYREICLAQRKKDNISN